MFLQDFVSRRLHSVSPQTPSPRQLCFPFGTVATLVLAVLATLIVPIPARAQQQWTWVGGSNLVNQAGVYGGTVVPGARTASATWIDGSGNLWLFGGGGYDSAGTSGFLNDLWEYTPANARWHWQGGNSTMVANTNGYRGRPGIYGQIGSPAKGNIPGSRVSASVWTDRSGNFWLFGGLGMDANNTTGWLNDLWEYSPSLKEWTWWGGSATLPGNNLGQPGNYDASGAPGGRAYAASWVDASGNFWLFGGLGFDKNGILNSENDLWQFSPTLKQWTFVSGSELSPGMGVPPGIHGQRGASSPGYTPGGRYLAGNWRDNAGNLWLFGGYSAALNDLWMFDTVSRQWAWMGGAEGIEPDANAAPGKYGPKGVPGPTNLPGGGYGGSSWTDAFGNFWLFGGYGTDSSNFFGALDALWEYNPAAQQWTFVNGDSKIPDRSLLGGWGADYGVLGVASPSNQPGTREAADSWSDAAGNLWLFGGGGVDSAGTLGSLNDLWKWAAPNVMVSTGGGVQSTRVGTAFASDLQVKITHNGSPVSGATVTFTAPASGASGTFAGLNSAVTNSSGIAAVPVFTANAIGGTYEVVASAPGANASAFALTNVDYAAPVSVTPDSGFGMSQQFTFLAQENAGGSIAVVWMNFGAQNSAAHTCRMRYAVAANLLYLMNDAGTDWGAGGQPGASGTLSNSQCSVSLVSTTVIRKANQLAVAPTIAFTPEYIGAKRIYLSVQDAQGHNSGPVPVGAWTVGLAAEAPPTPVSVMPGQGSGSSQQFSFTASSAAGAGNLAAVYMLIGATSTSAANSCYVKYLPGTNMFYLASDAGSDFGSGGQPGSSVTLSNSQCSASLATTTAAASGVSLTVSPSIEFNSSFAGNMNVYLGAADALGERSGLIRVGTWTP